jgi:hypothetical protein
MTKPTLIFIGRDGPPYTRHKIFLRTLLYSTAVRGWVIESMYIRVHQETLGQTFSYIFDSWHYGETGNLSIGSGLFVGHNGIGHNHHFVLNRTQATEFVWWGADCRIEIFARVVGKRHPQKLHEIRFVMSSEHSALLTQVLDAGVFFEWDADGDQYIPRAERRPH